MFTCPVVGVSFRGGEVRNLVKSLNIGDTLTLRADPENEYDSSAVAVDYLGTHIGFIPKGENAETFEHLMNGGTAEGEITMFETSIKPIIEVTLS